MRFDAQLPNECWQSDVTHWCLADETETDIVNVIDDNSRLAVGSRVLLQTTRQKGVGNEVIPVRGVPPSAKSSGAAWRQAIAGKVGELFPDAPFKPAED